LLDSLGVDAAAHEQEFGGAIVVLAASSHRPQFKDIADPLQHVLAEDGVRGAAIALEKALATQYFHCFRRLPDQLAKEHRHFVNIEIATSLGHLDGDVV